MASSTSKQHQYLDRPTQTTNKYNTINIFSDSKGNYLRPETEPTNININWASKSGANISDGIKYYKRQNTYPNNPSSLNLFWYGTCDITKQEGPEGPGALT